MLLGKSGETLIELFPAMANRHGLISGATGTGKTISLKALAESFSRIGVPVFLTDIKGDMAGTAVPGLEHPKVEERKQLLGLTDFEYEGNPVVFWDVYGKQGHPVRTTISEVGPLLLSRLLDLNDTQEGVMQLVFKIADDQGLLLLDMKDLTSMLGHISENTKELATDYGLISKATIGSIQRKLIALDSEIEGAFFGEPALDLHDLIKTNTESKGVINILAADQLMMNPKLYSVFLLWLLSELFETLPEVGDLDKPKFVLFFDEAHLMFNDVPKVLLEKITQVVRLIRSKGVGVYFVTQNPLDIPEDVLGQLGNRIQHALRVFTPKDQKAIKAVAEGFCINPDLDIEAVIPELGVGEALVSVLDAKGLPTITQRTMMAPARSLMGPIDADTRRRILGDSPYNGYYEEALDKESAFELLAKRANAIQAQEKEMATVSASQQSLAQDNRQPARRGRQADSAMDAFVKSAVRAAGSQLARQLMRGVLGSLKR